MFWLFRPNICSHVAGNQNLNHYPMPTMLSG